MTRACLLLGGAIVLAAPSAHADDWDGTNHHEPPGIYSYKWNEPYLETGIGVGVMAGGGVAGFRSTAMQDVTSSSVAGLWDLRISLGTHVPIGLDVSYVGLATGVQTIDGRDDGTLIGTTVDGAARWNILPHFEVNPYIFGGIGWTRFDVTGMRFATSDTGIKDVDNLVEFPVGVGVSWRDRVNGLVIDVRGTYRWTVNSALVRDPNGDHAGLDWWSASAQIGYEF